jgi:hypothetical protein
MVVVVEVVSVMVVDTGMASTLQAFVTSCGAKVARRFDEPPDMSEVVVDMLAGESSCRGLIERVTASGAAVTISLLRFAKSTVIVEVVVVLMTSVKVVVGVVYDNSEEQ